jgi:tetratricopeptide (TPR) repeat protein
MMNTKIKQLFSVVVTSALTVTLGMAQTIEQGLSELNAERVKEAGEVFSKVVESDANADNLFYQGYFFLKTNQLDKAEESFNKGVQADGKNVLNNIGLGAVALGKGDLAKANELIDGAVKKKKKDAQVLFRAGEAYTLFEKNNDPQKAIDLLDQAIARDKNIADAYIAKGDALMIKNEGGAAATAYEYALSAKPDYPLANLKIGEIYLRGKNYNEALNYYRKAIEKDPNFAPAHRDLAELFFFAKQYKRADESYSAYMKASGKNDPETILRASQLAFTADDYARSLTLLESIKDKLSGNPIIHRQFGWSYFRTNDMTRAIESIEQFVKEAPDKVIADDYKYLGRAHNKMATDGKEYSEEGMAYLVKGAELDTNAADAAATYKEIATAYTKSKEYGNAITAFEKGISLDTTNASTQDYYNLGIAYLQSGVGITVPDSATADSAQLAETRKAMFLKSDSTFAILSQKLPDWAYSYYWRGASLYYINSIENVKNGTSLPHYEKFLELGEADSSIQASFKTRALNYVAAYYQTTGNDPVKAKETWERLLKIDPNNAQAKDALQQLQGQASTTPK